MSEIRDFFIKTLDETDTGIVNMMRRVTDRLKESDPVVQNYLFKNEIHPQYYSFRQVIYVVIIFVLLIILLFIYTIF